MLVRVIVNPIAGGGKGLSRARSLCLLLEERGAAVELFPTRKAGDARTEAARPGADCVVAVGGDGSVNEVANGLTDSHTVMAILPFGTANVVARELRIPPEPQQVADLIIRQSVRTVDVGEVSGRRFLLGAGAGFDAAVVEELHAHRGRRLSFAGYVAPIWRTVRTYTYPPIRVTVDGAILCEDAQYAIVGNCRYSAGIFPFTPHALIDDGLFDICAFRDLNALRMAMLAVSSWLGDITRRGDVIYAKGRHVTFESLSKQRIPRQTDGDPDGELPATFAIEPGAISVVAPNR